MRNTSGVTSDLRLSILRAAWNPLPGHSLSAYGYFHDQAQNGAFTGFADNSYRVAGREGRWRLANVFASIDIPYIAEYAQQRPYAGGDSRVDADYWRLGAGFSTRGVDAALRPGSEGQQQRRVWPADAAHRFLRVQRLDAAFLQHAAPGLARPLAHAALGDRARVTLYGEAHRFRSDYGGIDFGRENDIGVT